MTQFTAHAEPILDPELPIIDPHHHLWDQVGLILAQMPLPEHMFSQALRRIPRYLWDELLGDLQSGHNIIATVYVECGSMYRAGGPEALAGVGEVEFANGVAAMSASGLYGDVRACAAIVGRAELTLGDGAARVLDSLVAAGNGRLCGIRHSGRYDADPNVLGPLSGSEPGLYASDAFRAGLRHVTKLGLSFDAWILEPQLPELIDLVRGFPDTMFVVDHVGTPLGLGAYQGRREQRFAVWKENIQALAKSENVNMKLGGLGMAFCNFPSFMADPPAPAAQLAEEWRPYIETCIEAFGATRCMFESNFPVDIGSGSYATLWNAFKHIAAGASAEEKAALFAGAAARVYRVAI